MDNSLLLRVWRHYLDSDEKLRKKDVRVLLQVSRKWKELLNQNYNLVHYKPRFPYVIYLLEYGIPGNRLIYLEEAPMGCLSQSIRIADTKCEFELLFETPWIKNNFPEPRFKLSARMVQNLMAFEEKVLSLLPEEFNSWSKKSLIHDDGTWNFDNTSCQVYNHEKVLIREWFKNSGDNKWWSEQVKRYKLLLRPVLEIIYDISELEDYYTVIRRVGVTYKSLQMMVDLGESNDDLEI